MQSETSRLLLVDDEAGLRRGLQLGLAQHGFTTDSSEQGLPALKLIDEAFHSGNPYRSVIADIQLPDINGLKLLEVIKSKYPTLPVIVISGFGDEITENVVKTRRGDGYLEKPFQVDTLAALVSKATAGATEHVPTRQPAVERQSVSAYALLRLREGADFLSVYRKLYMMENAIYCDAVHGDFDMVLLLNDRTEADLEKVVERRVRKLPEVAELHFLPISAPAIDPQMADFIRNYESERTVSPSELKLSQSRYFFYAYALVEIDKQRWNEVFPRLYFQEGVVSCDATHGACDVVLLLKAGSFNAIERILAHDIREIEGIVRARSVKIINMFEM